MGGGGKSPPPAPTNQTVTQVNVPEYARPYFEDILRRGQAEANRGYEAYGGPRLAGFTPGQTAAQQEALGMQAPGQFNVATGMVGTAGLGALQTAGTQFGQAQADQYMSPYMQSVVDIQKREAVRDAEKGQLVQNLGAARQGTYGGSRQLLAGMERERQLGQQLGDIQATGQQRAFEQAQQQFERDRQARLSGLGLAGQAAATMGQLGEAQQQSDLQRIQAQAAAGAEQQALQQQQLDLAYADFLRQRDYPMEKLSQYSALLRGSTPQMSSAATTYAAPPSLTSQVGALGLAGLGAYNLLKDVV